MELMKFTDKERDVALATEKIRSQLNESHRKQHELLNEISILKVCLIFSYYTLRDACFPPSRVLSYETVAFACLQQQLCEAKECLQAASRLSEQLDKKEEQIAQLNEEGKSLSEINHF